MDSIEYLLDLAPSRWMERNCLNLVAEQVELSQVVPSKVLLPQISGVQDIEAIDILPSDIDIVRVVQRERRRVDAWIWRFLTKFGEI